MTELGSDLISIHAPTRGATPYGRRVSQLLLFQSTLPRGERRKLQDIEDTIKQISIHAPTRGATVPPAAFSVSVYDFNPRSHEGSDASNPEDLIININFNPRSHEGSDKLFISAPIATNISIHAPTRGATQAYMHIFRQVYYFNPRSHEGSDLIVLLKWTCFWYFNPRSHEGSDSI